MIISASRRTDIPAFFTPWMLQRLREGIVSIRNPFNARQVKAIPLTPEAVDLLLFWSRDVRPLLPHLDLIRDLGFHTAFHITLTGLPATWEPFLPSVEKRIATFQQLSQQVSSGVVWRYDPIILSNQTPYDYHIARFTWLAEQLCGFTDRVIVSFLDRYLKSERGLKRLAAKMTDDLVLKKPTDLEQQQLLLQLSQIAARYGMKLQTCCEQVGSLSSLAGACIDSEWIEKILQRDCFYKQDKKQRPYCLCAQSIDIGVYNSCLHGCAYCYATHSVQSAGKSLKRHHPESQFLLD
ncbi:DUF1848 domain-containing protein [Magnetococcales bacterium HHB-1]